MMKVELKRLDQAFHLQATNEAGRTVETDGAEKIGGGNKGLSAHAVVAGWNWEL